MTTRLIAIGCYVLTIIAWAVDMLTPQLFVTAILLNGPIALSGLVLSSRLTISLIIAAQIANAVAGYFNGLQAGNSWNGIAIGDRLLSAASFALVGFLTIKVQEYARASGKNEERLRQAESEVRLRQAADIIRATLNAEIVRRSIVREALGLFDADKVLFILHKTMQVPETYEARRGDLDVAIDRDPLDASAMSLLARAIDRDRVIESFPGDAVARIFLEAHGAATMLAVGVVSPGGDGMLFVLRSGSGSNASALSFTPHEKKLLRAFADMAGTALDQAELFARLGHQNDMLQTAIASNDEMRQLIQSLLATASTSNGSGNATTRMAQDVLSRAPSAPGARVPEQTPLTPRETEILRLIAEGVGNVEIAERLHLGLGTVKGHISDILDRLSASDRTQAAVVALRQGYI